MHVKWVSGLIGLSLMAFPATASVGEPAPDARSRVEVEAEKHRDIYLIGRSEKEFTKTLADLTRAITANGFAVTATIDHSVRSDLPPTVLVLFDTPDQNAALIRENRYIGMELPMKAMVFEQDGVVMVTMLRIAHYKRPFGLQESGWAIDELSEAMDRMMAAATSD